MKVAALIRQHVGLAQEGVLFRAALFLEHGSRAAVDQALSRLARAGVLVRVARGLYLRPKHNRFVGLVLPQPGQVAEAFANLSGARVEVQGAEAARRLGLSTQVPLQPIFVTSGPAKRLRLGALEVVLRHAAPGRLNFAGTPVGLALAALRYLGRGAVNQNALETAHRRLPPGALDALAEKQPGVPAWLARAVRAFNDQPAHE